MCRMRSIALILLAAVALVSCNRDPNVAKKRYLESGNKYFEKGRYKEASIQYRNAIKIDPKYGEAHYRLALTALKQQPTPDYVGAVRALRRAVEKGMIPEGDATHWDAVAKLAEFYINLMREDEAAIGEAKGFCTQLLERDPDSFDGHRLTGDLHFVAVNKAVRDKDKAAFDENLAKAIAEYRHADKVKPGDQGVAMQLARGLVLSNDIAGAEALYRGVVSRDKAYTAGYRELYQLLLAEKKPNDAEELLKTAYQNNPKQYDFLFLRAQFYLMQNRRDEMLAVLQQIKSKAGEYPLAFAGVGDFYVRVGDGESALKEYREGISKDAKNKPVYQKRIIEVLLRQGKRDDAAQYNDAILKDNPNDPESRGLAATFLLEKGDVTRALVELQQVVSRSPKNPVAHFNLGRAYYHHGDIEQARQEFNKAVELRSDFLEARLALAQLQVVRGEFADALKTSLDVLAIDANSTTAKLIQSQALIGQKRFDESRQVLAAILKANPASADAVYQTGSVALAEKKYKEAAEAFRRSYELNPSNVLSLIAEARAYIDDGQGDKAIQRLQSEVQKKPKDTSLRAVLGNALGLIGRYGQAIGEYRQVLDATPKGNIMQGQMNLRIGEMYRLMGDFSSAINYFQEARKTLPDDVKVMISLALVMGQANHWKESRSFYETALKIEPSNAAVLNNLAFGMAENGEDLDQALQYAQRAKQMQPNSVDIADTLGWIYLKKNLADDALEIFRGLVSKQPNQSTFRYHLAMALSQKGDKAHAKDELKKALDSNPSQDEKRKIQDLLSRQ
jgi:tetratricopeptide (TPR) repeat protein